MGCKSSKIGAKIEATRPLSEQGVNITKVECSLGTNNLEKVMLEPNRSADAMAGKLHTGFVHQSEHLAGALIDSPDISKQKPSQGLGSHVSPIFESPNYQVSQMPNSGNSGDPIKSIKAKLSAQQNTLERLKQTYGARRDLLSDFRSSSPSSKPKRSSVRAVKLDSRSDLPNRNMESPGQIPPGITGRSARTLEMCLESPIVTSKKFISAQSFRFIGLKTQKCEKYSPPAKKRNLPDTENPVEVASPGLKSVTARPIKGSRQLKRSVQEPRLGLLVLAAIPDSSSRPSGKSKIHASTLRMKLAHSIGMTDSDQSLQDGPSLFQRSNSTRFNKPSPQKPKFRSTPFTESLPAVEGSEDPNSEWSIQKAFLELSHPSVESRGDKNTPNPTELRALLVPQCSRIVENADELGL